MTGHAPEGYYVTVDVTVRLKNGTTYDARWSTPLALYRAHAKGPQWMRQDLRARKVRCRSQIVAIDVRSTLQKLPDGKTWKSRDV